MSQNSKLVVIGGDAAGMSAASKVRRTQKDREIIVFERGRHTSFAACGMPYYIAGLGSGTNSSSKTDLIVLSSAYVTRNLYKQP